MDYLELNLLLKEAVNKTIKKFGIVSGIKSKISRALVGTNNQPAILKWMDDVDGKVNFGIKPLTKIANSIGYNIKLVCVKDDSLDEIVNDKNVSFVKELNELLGNYLENNSQETKMFTSSHSNTKVDQVVDDLISKITGE